MRRGVVEPRLRVSRAHTISVMAAGKRSPSILGVTSVTSFFAKKSKKDESGMKVEVVYKWPVTSTVLCSGEWSVSFPLHQVVVMKTASHLVYRLAICTVLYFL